MKIAILGFGLEGKSILNYLKKSPEYRRAKITICDKNTELKINDRFKPIIDFKLGNNYLKDLKKFRGNEHQLELVRAIRIHSGRCIIKFYNDSASTNPQTTAAAIKAFKEPKILIAGGKDKNLDYSLLAQALKNSNTKSVILFGENKNKIKRQATRNKRQEVVLVKDLKSAVNIAYRNSKFYLPDSKFLNIILSPASASFDMFKDYKERGEKFKEIVKDLKNILKSDNIIDNAGVV